MDEMLFAAKVHDETQRIKSYTEQLLKIVSNKNINLYDYKRFMNVLTCLRVQADTIKEDLNDFIIKKKRMD